MNEWIAVKDRLPEDGKSFLAVLDCAGDQTICTMRLPVLLSKNAHKVLGNYETERVTHWMPLPPLPANA